MAPSSALTVSATASAVTCGVPRNRSQHGQALARDSIAALTKEVGRVGRHVPDSI